MRQCRRVIGLVVGFCALCTLGFAASGASASSLNAYEVSIEDGTALETLALEGFDVTEGRVGESLEIVATRDQVAELDKLGLDAELKRVDGLTARGYAADAVQPDGSYRVYRPYFDDSCTPTTCYVGHNSSGNPRPTLYQEMMRLADNNPGIVKPVEIGRTINDVPILALRVTRDAREPSNPDGSKPAVFYNAAQHAREWITPEMIRRLAHLYIDNYGRSGDALGVDGQPVTDAEGNPIQSSVLTRLVNTRELWFVVVANPDGYDFTFTPDNRLWRKNLREINGEPGIQVGDGVDLNRNYPTFWNYDNEGSSSDPSDDVYRGSAPASEPETRALDSFVGRVGFEFMVNWHSAAELLLYGHGFQVQTEAPDDAIYRALSGTDVDPAIPGREPGAPDPYDPDLSSELYTTNGETTEHVHQAHDTLAWTPEMDVGNPDRGGGPSVFMFQDSTRDLQDAFEKNVPFALDVAESADDPADPESHLGRETSPFEIQPFSVSYGDPQTVSVNAQRELGDVTVHWSVNGGPEQSAATSSWQGGERYGGLQDVYYHELRGEVTGTAPGDSVRVWFEGGGERSQAFTYSVRSDTGNRVLVLAAEDYSGESDSPAYPSAAGPFFLSYYTEALAANGVGYDVYDVDAEGRRAPDPLGVLSHYDAVVWYTGNDLLTREPGQGPGTGVARVSNEMVVNVRDFLNEGGKLLYTGQYAATAQLNAFVFNVEGEPPFCDTARPAACIPISNDFLQYYLGAFHFVDAAGAPFGGGDKDAVSALDMRFSGGEYGTTEFSLNGAGSADNQEHVYSMLTTSSVLPAAEYPLFASEEAVSLDGPNPFDPNTGSFYAVAESDDEGWQRLRKTIDLTGATAADLSFQISYDTEPLYDYVIVEAHTPGSDDWTTLPDSNGHTSTDPGESCLIDWRSVHPFIDHYQTVITPEEECSNTGTTGEWNGATGNSGGYEQWNIDLSDYAGQQVEISVSYVQDFAVSGLGVFLDDVVLTEDGAVTDETSFEEDFGGFTAGPPPPGSEPSTQKAWNRTESLGFTAGPGVATEDTLSLGFGFEGISDPAARNAAMGNALAYFGLIAGPPPPPDDGGGTVDDDPPETELTGRPNKRSEKNKAKFKFRSDEANSSFECKLKGPDVKRKLKNWRDCDSPRKYKNLNKGKHKFKVRAIDAAGNVDPTPSKYRWRVTED